MKTTISLTYNRIPEIRKRFPGIVQNIVDKAAGDIEQIAKKSMSAPKHGKVYKRGKKKHRASAPGEAPAIDIGKLSNSIEVIKEGAGVDVVVVHSEYGAALEFGTEHIKARPFMDPAAQKVKPKFLAALRSLERYLK
jgi:HK97 gp10 family phage protein